MKIIDLLNKIANGEEVPKKIRVHYRVFEKYLNHNAYLNTEDEENYKYLTDLPRLFDDDRDWLNEEVEIIEEQKKIPEKLPYYSMEKIQKAKNKDEWHEERISLLEKRVNDLHIKMNDLLDYLKSKGE